MNIKRSSTDVLTRKQMMALSCAQTWRILTSAVRGGGGGGDGGGGGGDDDDDDHHHHHHEQQSSYFCRHRPTGLLVSTT